MKARLFLPIFAAMALCCSGTEPSRMFLTDVIQVREVIEGDPLAAKTWTVEGEEIRVSDIFLSDKLINRVQLKEIAEDRWDLLLVMGRSGGAAKWKNVSRRRNGKTGALLIDGKVLKTFTIVEHPETDAEFITLTIGSVVSSKEDAEKLQLRLDQKKSGKDRDGD